MYNCLIISGESNSGKSHAAEMVKKKLNVKTIHFDYVISFVCENIRHYFEKKKFEQEEKVWYRNGLNITNNEFNFLISDFNKLISDNNNFFENLYDKSIKNLRPSWSYRPGTDEPKDIINLGKLGQLLNSFGSNIIDLVFIHIIHASPHFVIEGIYFSKGTNFLEKLETKCKKISYLQTIYNQETKSHSYEYNNNKFKSLDEIIKKFTDESIFD